MEHLRSEPTAQCQTVAELIPLIARPNLANQVNDPAAHQHIAGCRYCQQQIAVERAFDAALLAATPMRPAPFTLAQIRQWETLAAKPSLARFTQFRAPPERARTISLASILLLSLTLAVVGLVAFRPGVGNHAQSITPTSTTVAFVPFPGLYQATIMDSDLAHIPGASAVNATNILTFLPDGTYHFTNNQTATIWSAGTYSVSGSSIILVSSTGLCQGVGRALYHWTLDLGAVAFRATHDACLLRQTVLEAHPWIALHP